MRGSISGVRSTAINKAHDHAAAMAFAMAAQFKQFGKLAGEAFPVGIEHVGTAAKRGQRNFARHNVAVDIPYGWNLGSIGRLAWRWPRIVDPQRRSVDRVFPRGALLRLLTEPDTETMPVEYATTPADFSALSKLRNSIDRERDLGDAAADQCLGRVLGGTDRDVGVALGQVEHEVGD